jgi:chemotaxis methyl-accepting protein methylase
MTAPVLARLIERITGLALDRGGVSTALDRFVNDRVHALQLSRIEDYVALAVDPAGMEQRRLIDAITVPHTWFYRDPEQLRIVAKLLVQAPSRPLAVWVAGCATGEEAYTLAMIGRRAGRRLNVLATDINDTALDAARRGVYGAPAVRDVPDVERRWFVQDGEEFSVDNELRADVTFARHNLVDDPPRGPRGGWDLIVCRNVLIYFAPRPAMRVLERFARAVREGGSLVVGASEVVFQPPTGLELVSSDNRLVLRRPTRMLATGTAARPPLSRPAPSPPVPAPPQPAADPEVVREPSPAPAGDDLVAALDRGHALFERGEIGAAVPVYDELARSHPSVAEVWLFLGIARYAHGEVREAADALRASLCLDPALWPAGFYLARAYERLGRRADALQQYDSVAVDGQQPLALRSSSAVINELRAFQHDFRAAARRLASERGASSRRNSK